MYNLSILLEDSARKYPDRDAVVLGASRLTYAQVDGDGQPGGQPAGRARHPSRATRWR